jgi:hypothetical protein
MAGASSVSVANYPSSSRFPQESKDDGGSPV